MQESQVQSLAGEDPLEKEMATHSSILAWRIPRTEEPGKLQPMGSERVRHDWATNKKRHLGSPGAVVDFIPESSRSSGSSSGEAEFAEHWHLLSEKAMAPHSSTHFSAVWSPEAGLPPLEVESVRRWDLPVIQIFSRACQYKPELPPNYELEGFLPPDPQMGGVCFQAWGRNKTLLIFCLDQCTVTLWGSEGFEKLMKGMVCVCMHHLIDRPVITF